MYSQEEWATVIVTRWQFETWRGAHRPDLAAYFADVLARMEAEIMADLIANH